MFVTHNACLALVVGIVAHPLALVGRHVPVTREGAARAVCAAHRPAAHPITYSDDASLHSAVLLA